MIKRNEHPSLFDKNSLTDDEAHEHISFDPRFLSSFDWNVGQCERVMLEHFSVNDHSQHE